MQRSSHRALRTGRYSYKTTDDGADVVVCAGPACSPRKVVGVQYEDDTDKGCELFAGAVKVSDDLLIRMEWQATMFLGAGPSTPGASGAHVFFVRFKVAG